MIARALGNLLLAALAVAATLLAGEMLARRFLPEWAPAQGERSFWRYDERLGWRHVPGEEGIHRHEDFEVTVRISEQGLRDRVYPKARTEGRRRMLVLGDSFAFGQGVEQEETWHEWIEARRPDWEIIGAAVAGWGTGQQLLYLESEGLSFAPDVVVVMLHPNDFLDDLEPYRYGYFKPTFVLEGGELALTQVPVPRLDLAQRFDRWLRFHTYLLYRVWHAPEFLATWREARAAEEREARAAEEREARRAAKRREGKAKPGRRKGEARAAPAPRKSKYDVDLELTVRLLERLREVAGSGGARLLVVAVPMADPPRARLARALEDAGIELLLLDDAFAAARGEVRHPNDPHWTPYGHEVAARAIDAFLLERGVFESAIDAPR